VQHILDGAACDRARTVAANLHNQARDHGRLAILDDVIGRTLDELGRRWPLAISHAPLYRL
jgi:hypothetical protein